MSNEVVEINEVSERSGLSGSVEEAIANGVAAIDPIEIGDHGLLVTLPVGYSTKLFDLRESEDLARRVDQVQRLVGVDSLARYVKAHQLADTRAYLKDVYGSGTKMLVSDTSVCTVIIDDHHAGNEPGACRHHAVLVLRPTAAARRWGQVLSGQPISQEQFLDLVVDGIAEIASPDSALLRDLVSDLHAIRTAEVSTIVRTGGQGSIQLAENTQLSAGTGTKVEFPERIEIVLQPFAGIPDMLELLVKVRPMVTSDNKVVFALTAPALEDKLAHVVSEVGTEIFDRTQLQPLWTP